MKIKNKANVKSDSNVQEDAENKAERTLTEQEQLEFFAEIIIDIYHKAEYENTDEVS